MDNDDNIFGSSLPPPGALPGCGCSSCLPPIEANMRMVVCPDCGNKRCPKATHHQHACSGSNESGQWGSSYGICVPGILDAKDCLIWAVNQFDLAQAKHLLTQGADIDQRCSAGMTALHYAAQSYQGPMIELLLAYGADAMFITQYTLASPIQLLLAAPRAFSRVSREKCARVADGLTALLKGVDPNAPLPATLGINQCPAGFRPLHAATLLGSGTESIKTLLSLGADINGRDSQGNTALCIAAGKARLEYAQILMELGADMHARNAEGMDALDLVRSSAIATQDRDDLIQMLLRMRALEEKNAMADAIPNPSFHGASTRI